MSTATTTPHVDAVREAIAQFEVTQSQLRSFGAMDTEPDGIFQTRIYRASKGLRPTTPQGVAGWELYSSLAGSRAAASRLSAACDKVIKAIEACPISEHADLLAYVQSYCWRLF
jgi:hypothetical protein